MRRLNAQDIRTLHGIAAADKRLDRQDRVVLAAVARTGSETPSGIKSPGRRVDKLRDLGYLP